MIGVVGVTRLVTVAFATPCPTSMRTATPTRANRRMVISLTEEMIDVEMTLVFNMAHSYVITRYSLLLLSSRSGLVHLQTAPAKALLSPWDRRAASHQPFRCKSGTIAG